MAEAQFDVIIVGAGVVGCTLGYALGKQGRKVLILERDLSIPDRIVGELLQPGGVNKLRELGMGGCLDNIDSPQVDGYAVFLNGKPIHLPYPKGEVGHSFHHGRFINNLRIAASSLTDNVELRLGTVLSLIENGAQVSGVNYRVTNGEIKEEKEVFAALTVVCDGCGSNLRSKFGNTAPVATSSFVGVIIKTDTLPFHHHGHVFLVNPGPVLAYQLDAGEARMLVDVPHPLPRSSNGELKTYLLETTAPQLPDSIRGKFEEAVSNSILKSMPNSRLHPAEWLREGVMVIGDAFNMRHPLTGGGMTVGISDAALVTELISGVKDLTDQAQVVKHLQEFYEKRKTYASTINILAGALYNVFAASDDPLLPEMREACIKYFELGGVCQAGPIALLSGLERRPLALAFHFFAVALLGVIRTLWPFPTPARVQRAYRLLSAASAIVVPLIRGEQVLPYVPVICRLLRLVNAAPSLQASGQPLSLSSQSVPVKSK